MPSSRSGRSSAAPRSSARSRSGAPPPRRAPSSMRRDAADRLLARRPLLPLHRGHAPHPRDRPRRRARARLRGRPRLPQRLRPGQAVVLRPGARPAAAASWISASTSSTSPCGRSISRRWRASRRASSPAASRSGRRVDAVEDYAVATLELATGTAVRLACSWRLQAGLRRDHLGRLLRHRGRGARCATSTARSTTSPPSATAAPRARR